MPMGTTFGLLQTPINRANVEAAPAVPQGGDPGALGRLLSSGQAPAHGWTSPRSPWGKSPGFLQKIIFVLYCLVYPMKSRVVCES
jgi:hypothetical protein